MPSLHQSVLGLLDEHDGFDRLAEHLGSDRAHVTSAAGRVVAAIVAGLASRAGLDDGPAVVAALLDGDDGSAVLDPAGLIAAIEAVDCDRDSPDADGATGGEPVIDADADSKLDGLLDTVFGDDRNDVLGEVAAAAEMGRAMTGDLVSAVAPVVIWALGRRRADGALDAAAVAELLASEHRSLSEVGLLDSIGALRLDEPAPVGVGGRSIGGGRRVDGGAGVGAGGGGDTGGGRTVVSVAARAPAMSGTRNGTESSATVLGGPVVDIGEGSGDPAEETADADRRSGVAAGGVLTPRRTDGGRQGGLGWLWWALGAAMLVLFLAWLLSTCDGATVETDARTSLVDVGTAPDTSGDAALGSADDRSAVAAPATSTPATSVASTPPTTPSTTASTTPTTGIEPSPEPTDEELQALVDTALGGSDVSGVVIDRIAALSGTVRTEIDRMAALAAVATVPGLASIDDAIVIEEALEEGTGTGEGDEPAVTVGVVAGATINELLDLDPVTFDISSDRITAAGRAVLDEVAGFLQGNPTVRVEIGGHTDNDGKVDANLDLSRRRAVSVKAYLEGRGVDGRRLETEGYGEDRPLVPNDSSAAKAENRRIEFTVL